MEAISADKNKMSMEGLLKLEEKVSKIQHSKRGFSLRSENLFSLESWC